MAPAIVADSPPPNLRSVVAASRSLGKVLVRRSDGWRNRSIAMRNPLVIEAARNGFIRARLARLPLSVCEHAQTEAPIYTGNECEDHARLKIAALAWMKAEGAKDACLEQTAGRFRHDAYSQRKQWVVECGNTDAARIETLICCDPAPRLTIIPYQRMLWRNRSVRRLLAVDIWWHPELHEWMMRRRFPSSYR